MSFGFITLISTASDALGATVAGSAMPLGLVLVPVMIAIVVAFGIYAHRLKPYWRPQNGIAVLSSGAAASTNWSVIWQARTF
jgi:uncharacterized membrane protein (DUF485 family)